MSKSLATIVLAGGKGTRMGSSDKHKVCFEVQGVPVILRALETYRLCGARLNVVVVGILAESVMATVNRRFPETLFAFQDHPLGTGHAARTGAEVLERRRFKGDVLVVAGDKVIAPQVIRRLLRTHERHDADVTLATTKRPPQSCSGTLVKAAGGSILGSLEEAERQRLLALASIQSAFGAAASLPRLTVDTLIAEHCPGRAGRRLLREIWPAGQADSELKQEDFEQRFSREERQGQINIGGTVFPANEILARFDQVNLSVYLFRAPVLYEVLSQLKPSRAGQEEYLTDIVEILANRPKPARVVGCEIEDPRDLMAFNNPQELLAIETVYRRRQEPAAPEASSESGRGILRK